MRYKYLSLQVDQLIAYFCAALESHARLATESWLPFVDIYLHHDVTTRSRLDGATICDSYGQIACVLVLQRKPGTAYVVTSA